MPYRGRVENGVVVLEEPGSLPEGTVVSVETAGQTAKHPRRSLEGLWAHLGADVSEEDIAEARREMWRFPTQGCRVSGPANGLD